MKRTINPILLISFLFIIGEKAISQSKKIAKATNHSVKIGKDSSEEPIGYYITAHFIDKGFTARKTAILNGKTLEAIKEQLNDMRNGLDIIIERVIVIKRNRREELLKNPPPQFMRETDSLLAKHWAGQYHKK